MVYPKRTPEEKTARAERHERRLQGSRITTQQRAIALRAHIIKDMRKRSSYVEEKSIPLQRAPSVNPFDFDPPMRFVLAGATKKQRRANKHLQGNVERIKHKLLMMTTVSKRPQGARELLLAEHRLHQHNRLLMDSWRGRYTEHIASTKWRDFRKTILGARGYRCEDCSAAGAVQPLQVHHLTYERMGHEIPGDVRVLCVPCHAKRH